MPRNPSKRSWRLLLLAAASVSIAACPGDDPPGDPDAVSMQVVLTTPSSDDGAVMLTITGPSTPTVESVDAAQRVYSRVLENGSIRVAVMGLLDAGAILEVEGSGDVASYEVALEQVATRENALRTDLTGYAVELAAD